MTAFIVIVIVVLAVIALILSGVLSGKKRGDDIGPALRELLLARAEGRLTAEEFDSRQAELHATLLAAPQPASAGKTGVLRGGLIAAVALAAVGLYAWLGNPKAVDVAPPQPAAGMAMPGTEGTPQANTGGDLNTMVKRLADKMAKDPNNGDGWLLLARTYGELRQPKEAAAAYAKAAALLAPDAGMLADWADAQVMSHDRKWDSEARDIVKRALAADPKQLKALALAGSEAFDRSDYKAAIDYWKRMQAAAPADSMDAKLAEANIQEANAAMTGKKPAPAAAAAEPPAASSGSASVAGTVALDAKLKGKVGAGDTVFVVVKAADGTPMPLAVKRFRASELPVKFLLDDSASMMPGRAISKFSEVLVSARLSKSGEAITQPGDIVSAIVKTKPGAADVKLELGAK